MAKRNPNKGSTYLGSSPFGKYTPAAKPATKPATTTVTAKSTAKDKRIYYVGTWPDGTPKLATPDGTVLPQGTSFKIVGNSTVITDPIGQPVQYQHGAKVGDPITDLTDLPSGSYDPGLLYQSQNANLGQLYGQQDYTTNWNGWQTDAAGNPIRPSDPSTVGRGLADYFRNLDRENENYATATGDLSHQYGVLANNQLQSINAAGALNGGALAQALAKRSANQKHDQSAIDTQHSRSLADLLTGTSRAHADDTVTLGRAGESNALYQGGLFGTATYQANQSGALVDNPNYETHNGVVYSISANGAATPVSTVKPKVNQNKPSVYTMPNPNKGSTYSMKPKKKKATGTGGTLAP